MMSLEYTVGKSFVCFDALWFIVAMFSNVAFSDIDAVPRLWVAFPNTVQFVIVHHVGKMRNVRLSAKPS